jgi:hypothetical protein
MTDQSCICKNEKILTDIKTCVPTKCKGAELKSYEDWVNGACKGQAGYPIVLKAAKVRRDQYIQMY